MAKDGIFSRVGRLTNTAIDGTERVTHDTFGSAGELTGVVHGTLKELNNETKEQVVESVVNLAKAQAKAFTELSQLGFSKEEISAMLKF